MTANVATAELDDHIVIGLIVHQDDRLLEALSGSVSLRVSSMVRTARGSSRTIVSRCPNMIGCERRTVRIVLKDIPGVGHRSEAVIEVVFAVLGLSGVVDEGVEVGVVERAGMAVVFVRIGVERSPFGEARRLLDPLLASASHRQDAGADHVDAALRGLGDSEVVDDELDLIIVVCG